uniref:40S ribosomal protein S21 n=1 Tax=Equus asinus TaxID=9793 RepID=A0A8C4L7I0_EQUAS
MGKEDVVCKYNRILFSPSATNHIIGAKDQVSIQMNMADADKVTGRFNGQFKTYTICRAICRVEVEQRTCHHFGVFWYFGIFNSRCMIKV